MAQTAEFEEKEYENPLNYELLADSRNPIWTPGQVFEEHFGIDAALNAVHPEFWQLFGYHYIPLGVRLETFNFGYIWRQIHDRRSLPTFRTNLLLQTKRPNHRMGNNAQYAHYGIKGSYWQFQMTDHQQIALEHLHRKLSNRALICYACAAFHTINDLYYHIHNHSLTDNSTFVQVIRMTNHRKWVYNKPGTIGVACSEIEKIEDKSFRDNLDQLASQNNSDNTPLENLLSLENAAIETIEDLGQKNPIVNEFYYRRQLLILSLGGNFDKSKEIRAFFTFSILCNLTNSTWLTVG